MTKVYNKLVRDRIPEIIESDGTPYSTEILPDDRYLQMLDAKLNEELAEYQESKSLEELADLLEVMRAVVKARGWTWEQLEQVRQEKAAKRGGFEQKILLKDYFFVLIFLHLVPHRLCNNIQYLGCVIPGST